MLIIPFLKASQAGNLSRFTLLHKLPPSDKQTNCFSVYAISDLLPQDIISGSRGEVWVSNLLGGIEWGHGKETSSF